MKMYYIVLIFLFFCAKAQKKDNNEPALKIQLNPPEQTPKDTIAALQDLDKLENEIRIGINEDFEDEKKKLIELQKARVHDIVHGGFLSLHTLIPNPIKASIRKAIRDQLNGKQISTLSVDSSKSENAVKTERTESQINKIKENIKKLSSFKQINNNFLHENNYELYNVNTPIFNPL